ncbi:MAG: LptF/LptG family permease, partial [Alphaproteobacteria bacterium]|nr:LptF/LptG family permease [Alphaproteobacteria bacterium]
GRGAAIRLYQIDYFVIHNGLLVSIIRATNGQESGGGWLLHNARRFDVVRGINTALGDIVVAYGVTSDKFSLASVDPEQMPITKLSSAIGDLRATARESDLIKAQTGWWHKFSSPLSALLMPLLASIAGFGLARSGKMFLRVLIGAALGVAYFIFDNVSVSMGNAGFYPPFLAAFGPFLLFALIGETMLITTEE